jgi:diguanylate cyclase (GGDEF)-like protein
MGIRRADRNPDVRGTDAPAARRPRPRGVGVSARLLGTIALPLVLLAAFVGNATVDRHRSARTAKEVAHSTAVLEQLVHLRSALFSERLADEIFVPARRPPEDLLEGTAFGRELVRHPEHLLERTERALAAVDPEHRPFTVADLEHMREQPLGRMGPGGRGDTRLDDLDGAVIDAVATQLGEVRSKSIRLGNADLISEATILERAVAVPEPGGALIGALADLWASDPSARLAKQSRVAEAAARLDVLSSLMSASLTGASGQVQEVWEAVATPPNGVTTAVGKAISGELTAPSRPANQPVWIGLSLLDAIDWLVQIDEVPTAAADLVRDASTHVADEAWTAERQAVALALVALFGSVALAVLFGRSIAAPVRRFGERAATIGSGRLDGEALPLDGPPEIVGASKAFNDMVENLKLLEQKSRALAELDFQHPALRAPLPGMLGASLERSIEVLSDSIEEREQLQRRLGFEATHDPLTRLSNRAALISSLRRMLGDHGRGRSVAVIFIDLDGFKRVNDRHGHAVGDELLQTVGARMQAQIPAGGVLARLGGDEFVCALPSVDDRAEAVELARRLVTAAAESVPVDGRRLRVGASAGVAVAAAGGEDDDPLEVLRKADLAVYTAKTGAGTGNVAVYDDALDLRLAEEDDVAAALRLALEPGSGELRMSYQPIVDSTSGDLHGFESLLRWDRPGHGAVPPDFFIPIAEKSGLVLELDHWVLRTVLEQSARWFADPWFADLVVSVNVSGRSLLDPTFVDRVVEALDASGVDPHRFTVEVTETAIVTDMDLAAAQLAEIRRLGVRVAIDDFGTGYTSIAHLRALPLDTIKIDSSFVHRLTEDANLVFVQMINELAHQLMIPTVAEGVETPEQLEHLRSVGCDRLQGYLFSPPLEADAVEGWVGSLVNGPAGLRIDEPARTRR